MRELATRAAREVRRARIRRDSATVAAYGAASAAGRAFHDAWGTPDIDAG